MVNLDYLYNPDSVRSSFEKDFFVDKKLGFRVIEHGIILSHRDILEDNSRNGCWGFGGILDDQEKMVAGSFIKGGSKSYYPPPTSDKIRKSSETVIYLGMFFYVWGHFLTDCIRHLWFLKSEIFKSKFKDCPLVYISKYRLDTQRNQKRLLEIAGVETDNLRFIEQPTQFDKVILPDPSFFFDKTGANFTNEYRETIDLFRNFALKNMTPTASKKFYYYYGKKELGEENVATYFKSKGYEIIRPARLTFDEQLNILINCESFASVIGSISHNTVFLRDRTEAILIPRNLNAMNKYQSALNAVNFLNANYVDSTISIFGKNNYCFIVSEQLRKFFGDEFDDYEEGNYKIFLQYVKKVLRKELEANPDEIRGYGAAFSDFMTRLKQREDLIAAAKMPPHWENFRSTLTYQAHVHKRGWRDGWKNENDISNDIEQKLTVQAIKINFPNHKVWYSVYYNDKEGWSEEVSNDEMAGTTGKGKSIYGIKIRLDEAGTKNFDILYRMHKFDDTWTPWAKNGETLYSYGVKLNAIQIKLEPKT